MSVELPLVLSIVTVAIITGSYQLTEISEKFWDKIIAQPFFLIAIVPLFLLSILLANALLEKPPFDPGHAETEIVMGWQTELKGKSLALVNLSNDIYTWVIAGLIATIFLSPPFLWVDLNSLAFFGFDIAPLISGILNTIIFVLKVTLIVIGISFIRTTQARLRIDQVVRYFWRVFLPITFFALIIVLIFGGL